MFLQVVDGRGKWEYLVTFFGGGGGISGEYLVFVFAFCFGWGGGGGLIGLREWVGGEMCVCCACGCSRREM